MLLRAVALVAVMVASGCGRELNPVYCAEHPDDIDCRMAGLAVIDAPPGCKGNEQCTAAMQGVCEIATGNCVECVPGMIPNGCVGGRAHCGVDRACHECLEDAHCTSSLCLGDGTCAAPTDVLYAAPNGAGDCSTKDTPCTLHTAVGRLDATRHIIRMAPMQFDEPPVVFDKIVPAGITVIGLGATFRPSLDGNAIQITAGKVTLVGLRVVDTRGTAITCENAVAELRRLEIVGSSGFAVETTSCQLLLERSRVRGNATAALSLRGGTLEIRNNIVDGNGGGGGNYEGNVRIYDANGRFVFNTVVKNKSESGSSGSGDSEGSGGSGNSQTVSGINCTKGTGGAKFDVKRNIIADNGKAGRAVEGNCTFDANFIADKVSEIKFAGDSDFHLTSATPMPPQDNQAFVREDYDADADCRLGSGYIDDFDGEPRPVGFCDRGADEYRTP